VHAGAAERRARARRIALAWNGFDSRAHFVECGPARTAPVSAWPVRRNFVVPRDAHFVEGGLVHFACGSPAFCRDGRG
jgi:hypothetical protein